MRWLLALICLSFATLSSASTVQTLGGKPVEKVLVLKSAHQLQLINDGKPFKTYRISLGKNPKGHKLIEGDRRTPEQWFHTLDWTDGCIGMRNVDMREVWNLVKDGTLIEIRP